MKTVELTDKALEDASYSWQNFTPMCVSWRQLARTRDETAPYLYKEPVRVVWDGVTILEGTIRKCSLEQSGDAWSWNIEACDILQPLEAALYFGASGALRGSVGASFSVSSGTGQDVPRQIKIADALRRVMEAARQYGLLPPETGIDVTVPAAATAWDSSMSCDTYAGVLRKLLSLRPGMVMWVDYSGAAPVIHVADGADLKQARLDRVADRLSEIMLYPRPDLVPPAVGVVLTAGDLVVDTQSWPRGASLHQEGCVTVQMAASVSSGDDGDDTAPSESPCWNFTKPVVEVRGADFPSGADDAAEWWRSKIPGLSAVSGVKFGSIKKNRVANVEGMDMSNYSADATAFEHVSDQLSEACKTIKWSYVEFRQFAWITQPPPKGCEMLFPIEKNRGGQLCYCNWFTWTCRTINVKRRKYRADKEGTDGGDGGGDPPSGSTGGSADEPAVPDYTAALRDYYDITRVTPWEGQVTALHAIKPRFVVGRKLIISGAREEYLTMDTVVQSVSVDAGGGRTSLRLGAPGHLSLQDMIDRVRQMAAAQQDLDEDLDKSDTPATGLTWDMEASQSPPAPTVGPEGKMVWASAPAIPPIYALQVALDWDDDFSNVVGSRMREVAFLMDGAKIGQIPGDNNGWKTLGQTSGEVWVNCIVNKEGAFVSAGVSTQQGPIDIYPPLTAKEGEKEQYSYSFHVATIKDKQVIQHMLGDIQLPIKVASTYPDGPAE